MMNSAFAGHPAFTMAFDCTFIAPVIVGKLFSGVSALVLSYVMCKKLNVE